MDRSFRSQHLTCMRRWVSLWGERESLKSRSLQWTTNGGESFKRNFIIYLVNCFFNGPKNRYCSKSILKYHKNVSQIPSLDWCQFVVDKLITSVRHYKGSTAPKGKVNNDFSAPSFISIVPLDKPSGKGQIQADTLVFDANVIIEKEKYREDVVLDQLKSVMKEDPSMLSCSLGLGLSQPDSQSLVPQNTSVPNPSTAAVNEDDGIEDDDDGAPLRFILRNTSQVNIVKKPAEKKSKEGDEPASKKGEVRKQSIKSKKQTLQVYMTGSKVPSPHNAKEPAGQSKEALSLEAERKQPEAENIDSSLAAKHEAGK
ncbi:LOW QUALITY PROTEIN: hypothetical protein Cgig2_002596 [Carnegiea gigantea]|uniref:Uncharacterized protein n=1 Tax=Carnegiea gigantea TaxID=171969 RepID=A0A9Q1JGR2_9CARY|nr:LOW QUALITY PROTEIN: hypothetical protein Cgig2_002596 [Carnegiea gigantea]